MKKLVEMPTSKFLEILCPKCKNRQVVFSKAATEVNCTLCGEVLLSPTGGISRMKNKPLRDLG